MFILLGRTKNYFFNSHLKINSAISLLAFMPLFAVAFSTNPVKNGSVINGVETPLHVVCDGNVYDTKTKANVVSEALKGTDCGYNENDLVSPAPETKLDGALADIFVTKATPVTVVDGGNVIMAKSAYKTAADILKQLKITVFTEDKVSSELIMSDFGDNGLGQKITIIRTPAVILEADGKIAEVRTSKGTVSDFLAEKKITLGSKDEVVPAVTSVISRGMKVTVTRVTETDVTEDEVIPFSTIEKKDFNVYQGQTSVESEGLNGLKRKVSRVVNRNGVLASKTLLSETVIQASKNKVVVIGVKPYGHQELWAIMVAAGAQWGVDPSQIYRVGMCESGLTPSRVGMAYGLMQYQKPTWVNGSNKYPGGRFRGASIFDPTAQIYVTAWKVSTNGWREWTCKP
ncbi:MAG: ubiquitin-like domain-containing protein [bacterium]|nr:ubiquitin-like domain-containing protein [bacterium]